METKELKITIPKGYEIDEERSTFTNIVFKPIKQDPPKSWEEYCNTHSTRGFYYIDIDSNIDNINLGEGRPMDKSLDRDLISSRKEAEAFRALMQLRLLRKSWVGEWEPEFNGDISIPCIQWERHTDVPAIYRWNVFSSPLSFPTVEMANNFLSCFKDLCEQAKMFL